MGLRVKRNTPLVTSDDVALGFVGLIVVRARRNETMPASPKTTPTEARTTATATRRVNGTSTGETSEDASHMKRPKSSATAGGGTFNSSEAIVKRVGHNARHERPLEVRSMEGLAVAFLAKVFAGCWPEHPLQRFGAATGKEDACIRAGA